MSKLESIFEDFQKALKRLDEVLLLKETEIIRDSAIQRFEFTLDLGWKVVKAFLEEYKGIRCASPKGCFRDAFAQNLIDYDETWNIMVDWRNASAHTYKEEVAADLYSKLPQALEKFRELEKMVSNEIASGTPNGK